MEHAGHNSSSVHSSDIRFAALAPTPLDVVMHGVPQAAPTATKAMMNSWFEVVRHTPHLRQMFVDVMVNGKGGELDVTQPLSCSLALHLFGGLRAETAALTDNVWLYTECKLAESTPAGDGDRDDVCMWPSLAGFNEAEWPSVNLSSPFPETINAIASTAMASDGGLTVADLSTVVDAVEAEVARVQSVASRKLAEQISTEDKKKECKRAAAEAATSAISMCLIDRWMSRRINSVVEPLDTKRLVDWCFFTHPSAERTVRAFNSCAQRRVFLACELKRVAIGADRNGHPFLVHHCVAQLLRDFAQTVSAAPCEHQPVMFGIASDFRTFHVLRFSMERSFVLVQYSAAVELAPRAVVDELLRDDSVLWCDAFARVGATGATTFATIFERIVRCAGANAIPTHPTGIGSVVGQRLPVPHIPGADLSVDDVQTKVRGLGAEWDNHDVVIRDFLGASSRSAVFLVDVERRDIPDVATALVMKFVHSQPPAALHFKNDVRMLLAERGRPDVAQLVGWYDDGRVQFLFLSSVGHPLSRVCRCTSERRLLLLRSLAETVGGVVQRWHSRQLVYSDLHGGNVLVRDNLSVFVSDLETLSEIIVPDVGSPVPLSVHRSQAHDVCEFVKLIASVWR